MLRQRAKHKGVPPHNASDRLVANAFKTESGGALSLLPPPVGSSTEFVDALDALRARCASLPAFFRPPHHSMTGARTPTT